MRLVLRHLAFIGVVGVTCVLTTIVNVDLSQILGFNFFTARLWSVIPAGAGICGFLAASGIVVAARSYEIRPTRLDAFAMIVVAAFMMPLFYYVDDSILFLAHSRNAGNGIDIPTYLDAVLTKSRMHVCQATRTDAGEVGQCGYALAVAEFLAFLLGGAAIFAFLAERRRSAINSSG
jgi:hypothetical protein